MAKKKKKKRTISPGTPPARVLGRIHTDPWQRVKTAARIQRMHFSVWAMGHLLDAADREAEERRAK